MTTAFETFTRNGIKFIAIPNERDSVAICDVEGNNYGSYLSRESFESFAERNGGFTAIRLGKVRLETRCLPANS